MVSSTVVVLAVCALGRGAAPAGEDRVTKDNQPSASHAAAKCIRLIFEYEGDKIRLIRRQEVDLQPPPSVPQAPSDREIGFWLEVRDSELHVMHRQRMHDPVEMHPEVFSSEPGQTIARAKAPAQKGAFTVVVPRIVDSDHIAFMRLRPQARTAAEIELSRVLPEGEVARFSLK
jgi:hypothetical protein